MPPLATFVVNRSGLKRAAVGFVGALVAWGVVTLPFWLYDPVRFARLKTTRKLETFNAFAPHGELLLPLSMAAGAGAFALHPGGDGAPRLSGSSAPAAIAVLVVYGIIASVADPSRGLILTARYGLLFTPLAPWLPLDCCTRAKRLRYHRASLNVPEGPMPDTLEVRLNRLNAIEGIKALRHRYWRAFDAGMPDLCRACHTADLSASYLDGRYVHNGNESVMNFITPGLNTARKRAATTTGFHYFAHPEITVTSETTAKGKWLMRYLTFDTLKKVGGDWKISKLLSRNLFGASFPLPNLQTPLGKFAYLGGPTDAAIFQGSELIGAPRPTPSPFPGEPALSEALGRDGEKGFEARLQALEDREAIRQAKHAYARALDSSLCPEMRALHMPEATTDWVDGLQQFKSREESLASLERNFTAERSRAGSVGIHMLVAPEVELLTPTTARLHCIMHYPTWDKGNGRGGTMLSIYHDDFVKVDGRWRIQHSVMQGLFTARYELPGLEVTPGPAAYMGGGPGDCANLVN